MHHGNRIGDTLSLSWVIRLVLITASLDEPAATADQLATNGLLMVDTKSPLETPC